MLPRPLIVLLVLAPLAAAGTLHVPAQFPTLQAAVDAAASGDTIVIGHGTYTDPVVIDGRSNLVLQGAGHPLIDVTGLDTGLTVSSSDHITVSGLVVHGALVAGILVKDSTDVLVQKCRVSGDDQGGWSPSEAALRVAGGSNVVLDRNHVDGSVLIGLWIWNDGNPDATGCTLTRNVVDTVWHACIEVHGSGHLVDRNTLQNAVDEGIFTDADATTLSRNVIRHCDAGITVFAGDAAVLDHNTIKDAGSYGVHIAAGATGTSLTNNKIISSGSVASLLVEASGGTYAGDRIVHAAADGAHISGSNNTVTDLRVSKPVGMAVVLDGATNQLSGVIVTAAGTDGLFVDSDGNALTSCKAMHCAVNGVDAAGNDNTFTDCIAAGNGTYDLSETGQSNSYINCTFTKTWG